MAKEYLPLHLQNRRHDDWPWPFKYIPRSWTTFNFGPPKLWKGKGNDFVWETVFVASRRFPIISYREIWKCPKPINPADGWQISYFPLAPWYLKPIAWYVAKSFGYGKDGKFAQFRFGARWDNIDRTPASPNGYVNWPTLPTGRRYTGAADQNTKSWA